MRRTELTSLVVDGSIEWCFGSSNPPAGAMAADATPADLVVEIGAGTGVLTRELARVADQVLAIEIDPRLAASLRRRLASAKTSPVPDGGAPNSDRERRT